jgi:DnaJ homolog subfamily C member 8
MNLANEGLEARKKDEEVAQRKRKAEEDKTWEGTLPLLPMILFLFSLVILRPYFAETREQRVDSWRNFSSTSKKKKKTKTAFLG